MVGVREDLKPPDVWKLSLQMETLRLKFSVCDVHSFDIGMDGVLIDGISFLAQQGKNKVNEKYADFYKKNNKSGKSFQFVRGMWFDRWKDRKKFPESR